jgi:hypothetical protein
MLKEPVARIATRPIEFKANRLQDAVRLPPIHQADGEGHHAVHARAAARQQKPGALLAAGMSGLPLLSNTKTAKAISPKKLPLRAW